jgi:hypothetical protein
MTRQIDRPFTRLDETERGVHVAEGHRTTAGGLLHRAPQDKASKWRRQTHQRPDLQIGPERFSLLLEPRPDFSREFRLICQRFDDARIEPRPEEREELRPNAIARDGDVDVGLVFDERNPTVGQPGAQIVASTLEQRPDEAAVARMHTRQAAWSGAAEKPQKKRFRLVVARMAERNDVGKEPDSRTLEAGMSRGARRVFE